MSELEELEAPVEKRDSGGLRAGFAELGSTGLRQYGGYIDEEFLPQLKGKKAAQVYRQMADNDAVCGAVLFAIEMLIRQVEWTVQAIDDSPKAAEAQEFVEQLLFEDLLHGWDGFISEALTMLTFGYAPMEIVLKRRGGRKGKVASNFDDGRIGIHKLALRGQESIERWEISEPGDDILGVWQQPYSGPQIFMPAEKLVLLRTRAVKNNPEGRSILRTAYRCWALKTRIEEVEGIGVERDLAGLPVAWVPERLMADNATPQEKSLLAEFKTMVRNIRRDRQEGVVMPKALGPDGKPIYDLTLLSTGGSRQFDTSKIVDRYNRLIATSVLADFLFLGQSSVGSWALSSDKTALFATAIGTILKQIASPINEVVLPKLWDLNGLDYDLMPTVKYGDIEKPDLEKLGKFIDSMVGAGATLFPDRELENHLRLAASLPEAPEESDDERTAARDAAVHGKPKQKAENAGSDPEG